MYRRWTALRAIADSSVIYGTVHTRKSFFFFLTYCPLKERIILCVRRRRKPFFFSLFLLYFWFRIEDGNSWASKALCGRNSFHRPKNEAGRYFCRSPSSVFFFFFSLSKFWDISPPLLSRGWKAHKQSWESFLFFFIFYMKHSCLVGKNKHVKKRLTSWFPDIISLRLHFLFFVLENIGWYTYTC